MKGDNAMKLTRIGREAKRMYGKGYRWIAVMSEDGHMLYGKTLDDLSRFIREEYPDTKLLKGDNAMKQKEESIHKHTPGPWTIYNHAGTNSGHYDGYLKSDIRAGADLIHIRQSVAGNTFPRLAANVRLMAAAPSMYDALWVIANMQIREDTDKGEVLALCMSIARLELEKCSNSAW
jgi:hypothetical protein